MVTRGLGKGEVLNQEQRSLKFTDLDPFDVDIWKLCGTLELDMYWKQYFLTYLLVLSSLFENVIHDLHTPSLHIK